MSEKSLGKFIAQKFARTILLANIRLPLRVHQRYLQGYPVFQYPAIPNLVDKVIPYIFVAVEDVLPPQDYFFSWSPFMEFTVEQIAGFLQGKLKGDADRKVSSLATIEEAQPNQITFLSNPKYEPCVYTTSAAAIIVSAGFVPKKDINPSLIFVDDPYSSFTLLLEEYSKYVNKEKTGVESPVYVGQEVTLGKGVYQGAFSYVGDHVVIGDGVKIYPHVFIGDRVVIGDHSILYPGAKLYAGTQLGKRCVIHAGAVIGSDGFGFAPQKDGSYKTIPQLGNVILGDDVSIGANTTVDRATLYGHATRVNEGTKIDNLVQIAHNVEIGSHTVMAAQAGISGSTKIGDHCVIAGQVGVIGHLKIANRTTIGAQAGVIRSVTAEGEQLLGSPSVHTKNYLRSYAVFRKLPDMYVKLEQIERKLTD